MINRNCISCSYLNQFLKDTCKQYDNIKLSVNGEYKKLSEFADDKHLIVINEVYISSNNNAICINASLFFDETTPEVVSVNKMMVHELLSIIYNATDLTRESDLNPLVYIKYPDGHKDTVTSHRQYNYITMPSRIISEVIIEPCDDCGGVYSAKITVITR